MQSFCQYFLYPFNWRMIQMSFGFRNNSLRLLKSDHLFTSTFDASPSKRTKTIDTSTRYNVKRDTDTHKQSFQFSFERKDEDNIHRFENFYNCYAHILSTPLPILHVSHSNDFWSLFNEASNGKDSKSNCNDRDLIEKQNSSKSIVDCKWKIPLVMYTMMPMNGTFRKGYFAEYHFRTTYHKVEES